MTAICEICHEDMRTVKGCLEGEVKIDGKWFKRRTDTVFSDDGMDFDSCHDCGAELGNFHHWRCDAEKCPKCGGQLISCGCKVTKTRS